MMCMDSQNEDVSPRGTTAKFGLPHWIPQMFMRDGQRQDLVSLVVNIIALGGTASRGTATRGTNVIRTILRVTRKIHDFRTRTTLQLASM